jgi:hypothetical protein
MVSLFIEDELWSREIPLTVKTIEAAQPEKEARVDRED